MNRRFAWTTLGIVVMVLLVVTAFIAGNYFGFSTNQTGNNTYLNPVGGGPPVSIMVSPTETPSANLTQNNTVTTVRFTGNGFDPDIVTVQNGDSVTWINDSDQQMWIASNPHPTHTDYPAFDELQSVGRNESYTFKFTKSGVWGYHNHPNPNISGKVIVL